MKKENLLIILLILIVLLLIIFFIVYGSKLFSIFRSKVSDTTEKNNNGDVAMVGVELNDAVKELIVLHELAQNQEQGAKIEMLLEKINFYKTELRKSDQKNVEQTLKDFYNSGLWEDIAELKKELENIKQNNNGAPELE